MFTLARVVILVLDVSNLLLDFKQQADNPVQRGHGNLPPDAGNTKQWHACTQTGSRATTAAPGGGEGGGPLQQTRNAMSLLRTTCCKQS